MGGFKKYHPAVNFVYFFAVLGFTMVFMHPAALTVSLICGVVYSIMLGGRRAFMFNIMAMLPLIIATMLINPVFNHEGDTVLWYLKNGNPITKEAICYGIAAGVMLSCTICHFFCFSKIMTSDRLIYLISKVSCNAALVFSMILRFVPRLRTEIKSVSIAQRTLFDDKNKSIIKRAKSGIKILSAVMSKSLEGAVETADSMKSRGFGSGKRTAYSDFRITNRDVLALIYIACLWIYIFIGAAWGATNFRYFPIMEGATASPYPMRVFTAYILLFTFPIMIEVWEAIKWKKLQ